MRKLVALLLIISSVILPAAAAVANPSTSSAYAALKEPFEPMDTRLNAMGGAGLAISRGTAALYRNPAGLAEGSLDIDLPSVSFTMYNVAGVLKSGVIQDLTSGGENAVDKGLDFLESLGVYNKVAQIDASVGFTYKGFGIGFAMQDIIHTYNGSGSFAASSSVINQINAVLSVGYGYRFNLPRDYSIDVGAAVRFNYLAYTNSIGAGTFLGLFSNSSSEEGTNPFDSFLAGTPMMAGFAVPIDIGITANMPLGFSVSIAARNINGRYYMTALDSINEWKQNPFGSGSHEKFTFDSDCSLDLGVAWQWDEFWWFKPTVALDIVDMIGFGDYLKFDFRSFVEHVNLGVELEFVNSIALRAGLAGGYLSFGLGIDLHVIRLDCTYFWKEYGERAGSKGVDAFTVNFTLGW